MPDLGYPLTMGNGMICHMERHPLLLKWPITFLKCVYKVKGDFGSIYKPLIVQAVPVLPRLTRKLHAKCLIFGTLSER